MEGWMFYLATLMPISHMNDKRARFMAVFVFLSLSGKPFWPIEWQPKPLIRDKWHTAVPQTHLSRRPPWIDWHDVEIQYSTKILAVQSLSFCCHLFCHSVSPVLVLIQTNVETEHNAHARFLSFLLFISASLSTPIFMAVPRNCHQGYLSEPI